MANCCAKSHANSLLLAWSEPHHISWKRSNQDRNHQNASVPRRRGRRYCFQRSMLSGALIAGLHAERHAAKTVNQATSCPSGSYVTKNISEQNTEERENGAPNPELARHKPKKVYLTSMMSLDCFARKLTSRKPKSIREKIRGKCWRGLQNAGGNCTTV